MPDMGPFSVDPKQVEGLDGPGFADLVGRLLAAEIARAGLAGWTLTQTYRTNAADGGVDAGLSNSTSTSWLPAGDSVWQFKAGDLPPAACEMELRGATAAVAILKAGGSYRLVLGKVTRPESHRHTQSAFGEGCAGSRSEGRGGHDRGARRRLARMVG